jgi:hypothetical protein
MNHTQNSLPFLPHSSSTGDLQHCSEGTNRVMLGDKFDFTVYRTTLIEIPDNDGRTAVFSNMHQAERGPWGGNKREVDVYLCNDTGVG